MPNPLQVRMQDGSIRAFTSMGALVAIDEAFRSGGQPLRANGTAMRVQLFGRPGQEGYLLDECPLNVILGGPSAWLPGQKELLAEGGIVPACAESGVALPAPGSSTGLGAPTGTTTPSQAGCTAGVCGPITPAGSTPPGTVTTPGGGSNTGGSQAPAQTGASNSPTSGSLGGNQSSPTSGNLRGNIPITSVPVGTTPAAGGATTIVSNSFDVLAFLKGPMGVLLIVLLGITLALHRK